MTSAASQRRLEQSRVDLEDKNREIEGRRTYIEAILQRIATGVISVEEDGRVATINAAAARLLALDPAAAGRPFAEVRPARISHHSGPPSTGAGRRASGRAPTSASRTGATMPLPALIASLDLAKDPMERLAVLWRLSSNGKRIGATRVGRLLSEEEKALNREVYVENEEIQKSLMPDEKVVADGGDAALDHVEQRTGAWKAWYEKRKARWEWSGWEQFRRRLLDTQFATYWGNLLRLDLGDSHVHRLPVFRLILARLPISITLAISSLIIAYLVSIPLGIWSAVGHRTRREQGFSAFLLMLYSLPAYQHKTDDDARRKRKIEGEVLFLNENISRQPAEP